MGNSRDFMLDEVKELTQSGNFEDAIKKLDDINKVHNNQKQGLLVQ